jgi:uncharacterized protein YdiU (UPF0061 family)
MELLNWMYEKKADYTNTFIFLMDKAIKNSEVYDNADFNLWKIKWVKRLAMFNSSLMINVWF